MQLGIWENEQISPVITNLVVYDEQAHCWANKDMTSNRKLAITVDVDWAPDWACFDLAKYLVERQVSSTWFVHDVRGPSEFL